MLGQLENWVRESFGWGSNPAHANQRGVELFEQHRYQEAFAEFDRAIAAAPYFAWPWLNRGGCRAMLGDNQAAIADYTRAIELNPQWVTAYNTRGRRPTPISSKRLLSIRKTWRWLSIEPQRQLASGGSSRRWLTRHSSCREIRVRQWH
jgi:tetratricopeptide (TPR) repeat protein